MKTLDPKIEAMLQDKFGAQIEAIRKQTTGLVDEPNYDEVKRKALSVVDQNPDDEAIEWLMENNIKFSDYVTFMFTQMMDHPDNHKLTEEIRQKFRDMCDRTVELMVRGESMENDEGNVHEGAMKSLADEMTQIQAMQQDLAKDIHKHLGWPAPEAVQ